MLSLSYTMFKNGETDFKNLKCENDLDGYK